MRTTLERWLASASLDRPWYRRVAEYFREAIHPLEPPPLAVTSRPVAVKNIWGIYGCQKKSWFLSLVLQTLAVAMMFAAASSPKVRHAARQVIELYAPDLATYQPKANTIRGGGGGNDGSAVPPSQGSLPKAALRQFAPPAAVNNPHPNWAIDPSILAPPDVRLPQIALNNYGDPWSKLVASSNGSGAGAGIGTGLNGGVGPGNGAGAGAGSEGGIGSGVYEIGNGVIAPALLYKVEPEYSEEARKAMYQGTVVLKVVVDTAGRVVNPEVIRSLGLGLDEKAVEAVKKWQFRPGYKNGRPVAVVAEIEVGFRLL